MKALIISLMLAIPFGNVQTEIGVIVNRETIESKHNLWNYDTDYAQGTFVVVSFDTNGTEDVTDDVIVNVEKIK